MPTKILSAVFLLVFSVHNSFCQTKKIDSLNNLISKATSDTARINLINTKISFWQEVNLDSGIALGKTNLEAARRINYQKGEADCETHVATIYCFKGYYDSAKTNLESAYTIYKNTNDSAGFLQLYSTYGIYHGMQSNYERSINFFKRAAIFAEQLHDVKKMNTSYQNIATSYQMLSNYPMALLYYQKSLKSSEQLNDIKNQAYIYINLGMTFNSMGDTLKGEQALLKAITFAKKAEIKNVQLYAYSNLSSIYDAMEQHKKAYDYAMIANRLGIETGDQGMEASSLSRAALQLAKMKKIQPAEGMARRAVLIADSSQQPLNIYQTNSDLGTILKMQNKYAEAIKYYEKAFGVMKASDLYDQQSSNTYFNLSECYEKTGAYQKALTAYKKYAEITDSIGSKENIRKATELAMNYDFNKRQQAIKAEQQKKDEVFKTKQTALIIGLALMLVLAAVALNAFQNKRKSNRILDKQKTEIQTTLNELKSTQTQLIQSEKMASLGELTAGIAHEIQNPLNFVNNFSEINTELITEIKEELNKENLKQAKNVLNDLENNEQKINYHGKRADAIVKSMLQHSRKSTGQKEPTDINALCDEYLRLSFHGLRAKNKSFNADFKTDFDESIGKINIVRQDIGRVLLNLINNAFYAVNEKKKTADENYKPEVLVQTKRINDTAEIIVKDNGDGIPQSIKEKIFQPFFTTKPTGEGTGLGLSLSYDIITKEHGGTIKAESKENEGTSFIINLSVI
jgi:signal transduction histidine kinase